MKKLQTYHTDKQLLRKINNNFNTWVLYFISEGGIHGAIGCAIVSFTLALVGKLLTTTEVSLMQCIIFWGICGGIGGMLWGSLVAFRALKSMTKAEKHGIEAWTGIASTGGIYGILLGTLFATLSNLIPGRPLLGVHPIITSFLFLFAGITIGVIASRSGFKLFISYISYR